MQIYEYFFTAALIVLALICFGYLLRTLLGPHFSDRIVAVNSISTIIILIIGMLSVYQNESYIVDIALIYALLGFITVVVLCKAYLRSHNKERANDLKNLEGEEE